MPFYKKSAIFTVLKQIGIESRLKFAKVDEIAFHSETGFHKYPKGIADSAAHSSLLCYSKINSFLES